MDLLGKKVLVAGCGKSGGHSSGDGSDGHTITPPQIKPGDRVLVAWVMNEACVIDVVTGS